MSIKNWQLKVIKLYPAGDTFTCHDDGHCQEFLYYNNKYKNWRVD